MPLLRILRYQQQRHASFVRGVMLLLLLSVTAAAMPRWVVHAHAAEHEATLLMPMDRHNLDAHAGVSDDFEIPDLGSEHLHAHYIGALPSLLPSMFVSVPGDALRAQSCPPGQVSSPCEGHLVMLQRPPIA